MIEVLNALATNAQSMTVPELITLLTTLVALFVAMERLVNAVSRTIRAVIAFVRLVLYGDYEPE